MFICNDCGAIFEEPKIYYEHHPYGMSYAEEKFMVCPYCGDASFEEAKECSLCGDYVADLTEELCEICFSDMYE